MKGFRLFITEAKEQDSEPLLRFEDTPPRESRLDTEFRIAQYNLTNRTSLHSMPERKITDRELPHQRVHVKGNRWKIPEGWVEKNASDFQLTPSKSSNITPAHKKIDVINTYTVHHSKPYAHNPLHPGMDKFVEARMPSGDTFVYHDHDTYGTWYHPEHGAITSTDFHNHLRSHEPGFFPPAKVNEKYWSTEHQGDDTHHVYVSKTEPFSAKKLNDWSSLHTATQDALHRAVTTVNNNAKKYGYKPFEVKAYYNGGQRNAVHLSNGTDEAVLLHVKTGSGSNKTLYTKFGSSSVTDTNMNAHSKVFVKK